LFLTSDNRDELCLKQALFYIHESYTTWCSFR
jgi:hypothetical protein